MKQDFWHDCWSQNKIGFHLPQVNPFLSQHFAALQVTENDSVFAPLCGKSQDLLWLAARVKQVIGVEISQTAVEAFFSENKLSPQISKLGDFIEYRFQNISLLCGDFFKLSASQLSACQIVYDRASLVALPAEMRESYVNKLAQILPKGNRRLLVATHYPQQEMQGPPFSVPPEEVQLRFAKHFSVTCLASEDLSASSDHFKKKGVSSMQEHVFLLSPKTA